MRKYLLHFWLLAAILTFAACDSSNNDEEWIEPQFDTEAVYILNEGRVDKGDGSLTLYNPEKKEITANVFLNQNKIKLGELPNAMLVYKDRMFIVAFDSNKIFVTDLTGKLVENGTIDFDGKEYSQPRNIVELNGKLYVNFYSGHLAQIDATTLAIEKVIGIEKNTEQMTIASNKKLYITDTGYGEGNTVTVIDLVSFSKETTINVTLNPNAIVSDNIGNVYVASWGRSWEGISGELSRIDTKDNSVHSIGEDIATRMAILDGKLLLFYTYYDEDYAPHTTYSYYDIYAKKHVKESFITIPTTAPPTEGEDEKKAAKENEVNHKAMLDKAYSITVDPLKKDIYITTTDYMTTGSVYVFSQTGNYKTNFSSGGINPNGIVFVTKQIN